MEKFNYSSYMKDNPLLKETSGYGNYTQPEKMLEVDSPFGMPETDEENPWMEEVDGTEAYTVGEWKCYYDYPGVLAWSYSDMPFDQLAVYATPNFDADSQTPIQIDVNGDSVENMMVPKGVFANFNEYAQAMTPYLNKIESKYGSSAKPETVLEKDDYIDSDEYDYMTSDETDAAEKTGKLSPSNAKLGPDEELMEGSGKVTEVFNVMMDHMRNLIKKTGLDQDDVQELRVKLAEFFK